ncbi:winged helix-turn-helix transcriptional regulator [Chryseobacterium oncorhynchi]|uniref:Transcriptional regulator n=1 Tax=Chryseobacterium oncorhynchi TaxID=741074 RepID=A0A316X0N8_9FLAO|nr:helix-turn-helix domain-containing protein [Chryseobacterium oncorhynchi]PWN67351.1 transcriptional regulator [Chryseobacterium oncorhynchi]
MNTEKKPCDNAYLAIQDTLYVIGGKWKLVILGALVTTGTKRFGELSKMIDISPRILSKELRELELNKLITRKVVYTKPVTTEYSSTPYAESLRDLINIMISWGYQHREEIKD